MKASFVLAAAAVSVAAIAISALPMTPRLIWNRTESLPEGLYALMPSPFIERGMIVAYQPSPGEEALLDSRQYTGRAWPLVKRVAALEGDEVCRDAERVLVNGAHVASAGAFDGAGRVLPGWSGCHLLGPGDILLLADHPRSVDGRYFGVQDRGRVLGKLQPLLVPGSQVTVSQPGASDGR